MYFECVMSVHCIFNGDDCSKFIHCNWIKVTTKRNMNTHSKSNCIKNCKQT